MLSNGFSSRDSRGLYSSDSLVNPCVFFLNSTTCRSDRTARAPRIDFNNVHGDINGIYNNEKWDDSVRPMLDSISCSDHVRTTANFSCPAGLVFRSVQFASWGSSSGTCGAGPKVNTTCHNTHSEKLLSDMCLGKSNCSILPYQWHFFSDSCPQVHDKYLTASLLCSTANSTLSVATEKEPAATKKETATNTPTTTTPKPKYQGTNQKYNRKSSTTKKTTRYAQESSSVSEPTAYGANGAAGEAGRVVEIRRADSTIPTWAVAVIALLSVFVVLLFVVLVAIAARSFNSERV